MEKDYKLIVKPIEKITLNDFNPMCGEGIVNFWLPEYIDMYLLATIIKTASHKKKPFLIDVNAGSGLISRLFADLDINVLALSTNRGLINQAARTYPHNNLQFQYIENLEDNINAKDVDAVYYSFMPRGENHTSFIMKLHPNVIIYTKEKYEDRFATRVEEAYKPCKDYEVCAMIPVTSYADFPYINRFSVSTIRTVIESRVKRKVLDNIVEVLSSIPISIEDGFPENRYTWEIELRDKKIRRT